MKKRIRSLVTAILLCFFFVSADTVAASDAEYPSLKKEVETESEKEDGSARSLETDSVVYINPAYVDVITEEDICVPGEIQKSGSCRNAISYALTEDTEYCDTVEEAGAVLRSGMVARENSITVCYYGDTYSSAYFKDLCTNQIIPEALSETGNANEGDYLRYNYGGTGYKASIAADGDGNYRYYTIVFTPTYFTTAEQETAVTETIDGLLENEFTFENRDSDYTKLYTVYDYICSNVTYDNESLDDSTYTLKYSTYAALINGTAVCQGYASLFYRLLREIGFGVRVATGYGGAVSEDESNYYENHAWNIAEIDNKWYYADSTWDSGLNDKVAAGTCAYQYFLKGISDFDCLESSEMIKGIHYLIMDGNFTDTYRIEETRYIPENVSECTHEYETVITVPTCKKGGYTTYTCFLCGDIYIGDETDALGHTWDAGTVTKEATAEEEGIMTYACTACGETRAETIPVKTLSAPSVTVCVSRNNGKIRLTGKVMDYENSSNYYEITGHGFIYVTKSLLGTRTLTVNITGRTKVSINGIGSTGNYSYIQRFLLTF